MGFCSVLFFLHSNSSFSISELCGDLGALGLFSFPCTSKVTSSNLMILSTIYIFIFTHPLKSVSPEVFPSSVKGNSILSTSLVKILVSCKNFGRQNFPFFLTPHNQKFNRKSFGFLPLKSILTTPISTTLIQATIISHQDQCTINWQVPHSSISPNSFP